MQTPGAQAAGWTCPDCGKKVVVGSIDEIEKLSGVRPDDLHRQYLDKIHFPCPDCGAKMTRVPEVLDCWFESGSVRVQALPV